VTRRNAVLLAVCVLAGAVLPMAIPAQPGDTGRELFEKRCGGCHALDRDKEGPRLGGVYGRAAGSLHSFEYSAALKKAHLVWNDRTLDEWLTDPDKLVPGTDMAARVDGRDERNAIITFLKQNSGQK